MEGPYTFDADDPIPLTGERTAPGIPEENYWFQRHVVAYRFAADVVRGRRVLDAGCGEGYGTAMLAETARKAFGIDIDRNVVGRAGGLYPRAQFEPADLMDIPFPRGSFGAVVSLQVIEHLPSPADFVAGCARVLEPDGVFVISTPNRLTFSPDGIRNPFHTFEFSPTDLRATLEPHFRRVDLLGTFHGLRLRALDLGLRTPFPERLIAQPVPEWPGWLRRTVERVTPEDFAIRSTRLERSLDLIAIARV